MESSRLTIVDLFEGVVLIHGVRGAPEPRPVGRRSGETSTLITTLVALPQGGGVKRTTLPMPGPRAMSASVSYYRVVQVDVRAPFDKGRLVVRGHVT